MVLHWVNIELVAERWILAGDIIERGGDLGYSRLSGFARNETPVDREGAFARYNVVGNTCLNRIDTDDWLPNRRVKAIDILFQRNDRFRRFRDSIDASDPCRRGMCRATEARHIDGQQAAFSIPDLEVALFTDEAVVRSGQASGGDLFH